jgi:hypothetical protein
VVTKEGGRKEFDPWGSGPFYTQVPEIGPSKDDAEVVRVPGAPPANSLGPSDDDVTHLMNWLRAMQDRKQPNANVDHGFSHAIVVIMAAQAYWSGKRLYWDPKMEEIVDRSI